LRNSQLGGLQYELQGDSIREIHGGFGAWSITSTGAFYGGTGLQENIKTGSRTNTTVWFKSSRVCPVTNEIRPINKAINYYIRAVG